MFSRIIPSWEQIKDFKQPLTDGEAYLLKFLDDTLKKDETFKEGDDKTKYNGWLIFVQPFLITTTLINIQEKQIGKLKT